MNLHWICVFHRWGCPPGPCGERGTGDSGAAAHVKATGHPTVTTTREDLADQLAGPLIEENP